MPLVVDIESRSLCDIKKMGAWVYSRHPTTKPMCIVGLDTDTREHRVIDFRHKISGDGIDWFNSYHIKIAHNVTFEYSMFENKLNEYGFVQPKEWFDTQDIAAYMGAPLSLEKSAEFLLNDEDAVQKDKEGKKLMRKICCPSNREKGTFSKHTEEDFQGLIKYCLQDCVVSAELYREYGWRVPPSEWDTMTFTQRLNKRGIPVDLELVDRLLGFYQDACNSLEAPEGLAPNDARRVAFMKEKSQEWGYPMNNMQAETVQAAIDNPRCPDALRQMLECRQILTLASIKKLDALVDLCDGDSVVRNGFQYHGAKTGRFAGRGVQPQNLPRGYKYDIDIILARCLMGLGL